MTFRSAAVAAVLLMLVTDRAALCQVRRTMRLIPGTSAETAVLASPGNASVLSGQTRTAPPGAGWAYSMPALPRSTCRLTCFGAGHASVAVTGPDGKPLPLSRQALPDGFAVSAVTGPAHPIGGMLTFRFKAVGEEFRLTAAEYSMTTPDANGNGVPDPLETVLIPCGSLTVYPRPARPMTSFQTGRTYTPELAVHSDAVLVYSSAADILKSWRDAGYAVQCMGGFREYEDYAKEHLGEVQTDRAGRKLLIGGNSYYMLPTAERNRKSAAYYLEAARNGAAAVCPEEPEIFASAGYSEAFKSEWQAAYGSPWVPPHTDVNSRYRSERLKARLTVRQIDTILTALAQQFPAVRRMLAVHSPVTYSHWGIVVPHFELFQLPAVQEVIAQVWTGTARTPNRVAGVRAERTFQLAYLEYSSIICLLRGLGKPVWMLMDPVEDNPDRPMDDYRRNYVETLVASLMFPTADRFEVMPWPERVYGRVPPDYAAVVNTVVGALSDCWRYPARVRAGTQGIGMLIADSMAYQRAEPSPSDFDGVYGLSLPLIEQGIPVDALSLDRCADSRYLTGTKVLLGSYDFLKPPLAACNAGLADWVRRGGVLMMFGGTDAYDAVSEGWWRAAGYDTPLDHLFGQLGIETRRRASGGVKPVTRPIAREILRGDGTERRLANKRRYALDLTPFVQASGSVCVRFEDVTPVDGWGPYVSSVELRLSDRLAASFLPGSEMETRFLSVDHGSLVSGDARFADGKAFWEYRFDNLPRTGSVTLIVEMGNGFLVSAYTPSEAPAVLECLDPAVHPTVRRIRTLPGYELTSYDPPAGSTVLYRRPSDGAPAVWMVKVGAGTLFYCGMPPGFLSATSQTDRWITDLVRRACSEAGMGFEPAAAFVGYRGPYVALRAIGGSEQLSGRYVDLLSADLRVLEDPEIKRGQAAFLKDVGKTAVPGLMAVSGRLAALAEGALSTVFVVRAPEGSSGAARVAGGTRTLAGVKAWDLWGRSVPVSVSAQGSSALIRYTNRADGVAVRVVWK